MTRVLENTATGWAEAAALIRAGGVLALPTDTVYGLMADATCDAGVAKVFAAKGRREGHGVLVNVHALDAARQVGDFSEEALALARKHWPGALTLVVPLVAGHGLSPLILEGGAGSVGLRVPDHGALRGLLDAVGVPLTSTSANLTGQPACVTAQGVLDVLGGKIDAVLEGGPCPGVASTIVRCVGAVEVVRRGAVEL